MKFACVLAILVVFMATSQAMVIEIDDFAEWKERLTNVADRVQEKLSGTGPSADKFDEIREKISQLNDPDMGIVLELTLLEYGRYVGKQVQCRFDNNNFNCLSIGSE
ncbi:uncharacterized protein LOC141849964 [Brevipalpus obovatus]|uniref:uncharacterized protein LOC141849964 n=1 Tax=Brevipalpus obovatus TaxID=246614 RepID=UPI003D9F5A05